MALIIVIRNLVIAGILAWLGIEFVPDDKPETPDSSPQSALMIGH
ncbi:MAG: hypothetical protein R3C13_13380 [Hyphomonas sp.]